MGEICMNSPACAANPCVARHALHLAAMRILRDRRRLCRRRRLRRILVRRLALLSSGPRLPVPFANVR